MSFKDVLAAAKAAERERSEPVDVLVGDQIVTVRFTRAAPTEWARVTSQNPATSGSLIAVTYGYDIHRVVPEIAALTGVVVEDGEEVRLTVEKKSKDNPEPVNEWADLLSVLDGHSFGLIADAVWGLNEWGPQVRLAELKKGSPRS